LIEFEGFIKKMLNLKILIVEDEIIVAEDLKQRLENLGYNIVGIAAKGRDALKITGETNPDLILMDIMLKGELDGIDTAQTIRNVYNIPFIYLTGSTDNTIRERAETTKPLGYIIKPFDDIGIQNSIEIAFINKKNKRM
jgi:CheY-like chemotaxis protein